MLMAFASCEEDTKEDAIVKGIFEKMTASEEYTKWKSEMKDAGTTVTEKLDGDSIVFIAESKEEYGTNGEFVFKRDGDYIVYTPRARTIIRAIPSLWRLYRALPDTTTWITEM